MTLPARRALAFLFVCAFAIVAPAALAYGRGYRFDLATRSFRQTGVIVIAGQPKNTVLGIDGKQPKPATLPKTLRGITTGTHLLHLEASGYESQQFSVPVQAGQSTIVSGVQLLRPEPFLTLRTGIPGSALLAPAGQAVAWIADGRVHVQTENAVVKSPVIGKLTSVNWAADRLEVFDATGAMLGTVSQTGTFTVGGKPTDTVDTTLAALAKRANLSYSFAERLDSLRAWFLTNAEGAWLLDDSGKATIVSRWFQPPHAARLLQSNVLAIFRNDGVTLRNLITNHTVTYPIVDVTAVSQDSKRGTLDLLAKDGDLQTWVQADFF